MIDPVAEAGSVGSHIDRRREQAHRLRATVTRNGKDPPADNGGSKIGVVRVNWLVKNGPKRVLLHPHGALQLRDSRSRSAAVWDGRTT